MCYIISLRARRVERRACARSYHIPYSVLFLFVFSPCFRFFFFVLFLWVSLGHRLQKRFPNIVTNIQIYPYFFHFFSYFISKSTHFYIWMCALDPESAHHCKAHYSEWNKHGILNEMAAVVEWWKKMKLRMKQLPCGNEAVNEIYTSKHETLNEVFAVNVWINVQRDDEKIPGWNETKFGMKHVPKMKENFFHSFTVAEQAVLRQLP